MPTIVAIGPKYFQPAPFSITRAHGHENYTFLHFFEPITFSMDGKTITTKPHACILFEPKVPQFFQSEKDFTHDWIHFDLLRNEILPDIPINTIFYPTNVEQITFLSIEVGKEFVSQKPYHTEMAGYKLNELFITVARAIGEYQQTISQNTIKEFELLRLKMQNDTCFNQSVQDLANSMALSPSRFLSLYKTIFGISPIHDLINFKIGKAKILLAFSNKSIKEISIDLKYNNYTHFIRQFTKIVGVTPLTFRKNNH